MKTWMVLATLVAFTPLGHAQHAASASNMTLLGHHDLQGRSAYQPVIHEQNGRWIAYIGHHGGRAVNSLTGREEDSGTSIVDVTDPRNPRYLAHIPGEPGQAETGGAQMVRVCSGKDLPKADKSKFYLLRTFGNLAHEVWDVTAPEKPSRIVVVVDKLKGTHKSWWECDSGIAYLVSGLPDWRTRRMTQVFDLSDPARPLLIRNFGLPGQQPGASGPVPTELHGPISTGPEGNRVYLGYGTNKDGILQIVDRAKLLSGPREPTPENLLAPQVGRFNLSSMNGAHSSLPVLGMELAEFAKDKAAPRRDFVVVVNESLVNECLEPRQALRLALLQREPAADVRRAHRVHGMVQRRRARGRHPRSVPSARDRLLHPGHHRQDRQALRQGARRSRTLQGRHPDQQPRRRRPRLYLPRRPRQHRDAHPGALAEMRKALFILLSAA